jgi:hypothetical protein
MLTRPTIPERNSLCPCFRRATAVFRRLLRPGNVKQAVASCTGEAGAAEYRGLITGNTAPQAAFVAEKTRTKYGLVRILRQILVIRSESMTGYTVAIARSSLNS